MFLKLKPSSPPLPRMDDGDKQTRRRRRLSKPPTNKSATNLQILSVQQSEGLANNSSDPDICPASLSTCPCRENGVEVPHSAGSDPNPDGDNVWKGTAFIVTEDSVQSVDSLTPLSSKGLLKPKRPLSAIFTTPRFSSSRTGFAQRRAPLKALVEIGSDRAEKNLSSATLACPSESRSEALSPRAYRRSSFTPGVATRTSEKASLGPPPEEEQSDATRNYYYNSNLSTESPLGRLECLDFDKEWAPPAPPGARSETPSDLDYTHLGGLRLGSLRVVNGGASPAPSELSRHLTGALTPNLKRDTSSEYGDGDDRALLNFPSLRLKSYRGRDLGLQNSPRVLRRPASVPGNHSDTLLLPKRNKAVVNAPLAREETTSGWVSAPNNDVMLLRTVSRPPDKASELAMEYMAELAASPYFDAKPASPAGSVLISTSKATEFDDNLFEDDAADVSPSEDLDHPTPDTQYSPSDATWVCEDANRMSVKRSRDTSSRFLQPSNSTGSSVKPDSGYGSKASLQSSKGQNYDHEASCKIESTAPAETSVNGGAMGIQAGRTRPEPRPNPTLPRPSILKQGGSSAPQLPTFSNLYPSSSTTLATITSTNSAPSDAPAKPRKLQKKARPRSQPPPVRQIVIQGDHRNISNSNIPPIPAEVAANLAIRTEQVPELGHTFSSMHHTRKFESSHQRTYAPTLVHFPKPDASPPGLLIETVVPAPPPHRSSFMMWSKSGRKNGQGRAGNEMNEDDAMAVIYGLGTAMPSMGGSPYDLASKTTRSAIVQVAERQKTNDPYLDARKAPRRKPMMDDATAAELARVRSRSIAERDNMQSKQRRSSFNDRGGIPGANLRLFGTYGDVPPLPPLPSHERVQQKKLRETDYRRPYLEPHTTERMGRAGQFSSDAYESPAPAPPSHSPQPRPVELEGDRPPAPPSHSPQPRFIELEVNAPRPPPPPSHSPHPKSAQMSEEVSAPPPPSHSPHPTSAGPQKEVTDIWAAQASAWKLRRRSVGEILRSRTTPLEQQYSV